MEHAVAPKSTAGFSLIEVLVAAAVLAVLAAGVSLSVGREGDKTETDQALFQRNFDALAQIAIAGAQTKGMQFTPKGMQLATKRATGWDISEHVLTWRGRATVETDRRATTATEPDLVFLANGESTPFTIVFRDGTDITRCKSDGFTGLTCE